MSQTYLLECQGCGSMNAIMFFEPRYHGFRGQCPECGNNWPES